jgi:uncharacterized protein (TIGR02246 family)
MKRRMLVLPALLLMAMPMSVGFGNELSQETINELVGAIEAEYAAAFELRDAGAMTALFTEDATIQTEWGAVLKGREVIAKAFATTLENALGGEIVQNEPVVSSAVSDATIVTHGVMFRVFPGGALERFFYTRVLVRQKGGWRIAATQIARPSTVPKPPGYEL